MERVHDLHTHSSASDGTQTPAELVEAAAAAGVHCLALTDHDTVAGLEEARQAARAHGLDFVPGAEFSASWARGTVHVLGLGLDPDHGRIRTATRRLAGLRRARAERIALKLERAGMPGMLSAAQALASGEERIGRSHFARALAAAGHVRSPAEAFRRLLGRGRPAAVASEWPPLDEIVDGIRAAGGVAVLAHPLRYRLTRSKLLRLLEDFRAAQGGALEVVTGRATPGEIRSLAGHARRFGLSASAGSDYHGAGTPWLVPGRLAPLPPDLRPVWEAGGLTA